MRLLDVRKLDDHQKDVRRLDVRQPDFCRLDDHQLKSMSCEP